MTDYHTKPVLAVRVPGELQDWARAEAERRDQGIGDFVTVLLAAERDRMGAKARTKPARNGRLRAIVRRELT